MSQLSPELRDIAALDKQVVLLGQGNKIEIWDATRWRDERDEWLDDVGTGAGTPSTSL